MTKAQSRMVTPLVLEMRRDFKRASEIAWTASRETGVPLTEAAVRHIFSKHSVKPDWGPLDARARELRAAGRSWATVSRVIESEFGVYRAPTSWFRRLDSKVATS